MKKQTLVRGYSDGDVDTNRTGNASLESMVSERYSRRETLFGGMRATAMALFGTTMLAACDLDVFGSDDKGPTVSAGENATTTAGRLVTLTGTAETTSTVTSAWRQTGGPAVTLQGTGNSVTFFAPGVAASTELTFEFTATEADGDAASATTKVTVQPAVLGFDAVPKNLNDIVTVPAGYAVKVMTRLGDPIAAGVAAYANNGTDRNFAQRIGDHGDALYYYGLNAAGTRDDNSSTRGLLVQNHENLGVQYLHPNGPTNVSAGPRPEAEAIKEIEAHGVSVTEYRDSGNRAWTYVQDSALNRRITPNTPVAFHGPVRGAALIRTALSPDGTQGRGTINNCANGHTPWGTNLTCEENWSGYFTRSGDDAARTPAEVTSLRRYGVTRPMGNYAWSSVASTNTIFRRWDARATGATALADYRNEPNQFGWVLEIDPYNPGSTPRKRTALGRMGHEGAWRQADRRQEGVRLHGRRFAPRVLLQVRLERCLGCRRRQRGRSPGNGRQVSRRGHALCGEVQCRRDRHLAAAGVRQRAEPAGHGRAA
jgi:secreted PhoX family phosphatase